MPETSREISVRLKEFAEKWEIDPANRMIRRKKRPWFRKIRDFVWPNRTEVKTIYRGMMRWSSSEEGIVCPTPIDRDRIEIRGVAEKFVLQDGWHIADQDIGALYGGPLIYQGNTEIVVPELRGTEAIKVFGKEWGPLLGIVFSGATLVFRFLGWI